MAIPPYQMTIESFKKIPPEGGILSFELCVHSEIGFSPSKTESRRIHLAEDS